MITANIRVIAFAMMIGKLSLKIPNKSHKSVPAEKSRYMKNEILRVSFVRIVLIACGTNELVVSTAAANPIIVMNDIILLE